MKSRLLDLAELRALDGPEYAQLADCFVSLGERRNAAGWYHRAALIDTGEAGARGYCSYRYWRTIMELTGGPTQEDWQQHWLEVYEAWPDRAEPLYWLVQGYIDTGAWQRARELVDLALEIEQPLDSLPFEEWIYDFGLHQQATRVARAGRDHLGVLKHSIAALRSDRLPHELRVELYAWQSEAYLAIEPLLSRSRQVSNHFVVIVPFRNCAPFLQATIDSLATQHYRQFKVLFFDDGSSDGGLQGCRLEGLPAWTVVRNETSRGALANQVEALENECEPDDIAVFLDGDDRLADAAVLKHLNEVYNQSGCWLTYGQFAFGDSDTPGYARPILAEEGIPGLFKTGGLKFPVHLRTHRAGLFQRLLEQDPGLECFRQADGKLVRRAADVAHMRALLMLTPRQRVRYVSRVLYRYNTANPASHFQGAGRREQFAEFRRIARKPTLEPVTSYRPRPLIEG